MIDGSQLRIVGGEWRGRKLEFLALPGIRPTPDRVRETLFNWLMFHIQNTVCLDLFSGSGALAFEAVSRGARQVTLVDSDPRVCQQLNNELKRFNTDRMTVVAGLSQNFLSDCVRQFDIIFLDPPFDEGLLEETLASIAVSDCVPEQGAYVYIECRADTNVTLPLGWQLLRKSKAAQVQYMLTATSDVLCL